MARKNCFEDMPIIRSKKSSKLKDHDPAKFFKQPEKVAEALLTSLKENDVPAFLEILNTYLCVNSSISHSQVCK
ncbi:MAG: hypothetical protein KBA81_05965 [Rhabdochlamydiaceae bacterium]|jgi:DNA-binding phage protein|nr:hypothetical protein [Rhabdochlamydiaceae bacterium]